MGRPAPTVLFSIIIPTLNAGSFIGDCLASVVNQTCRDFEVIVLDGDSTDDTVTVASGYQTVLGDRLRIQVGRDTGVYEAMNKGVKLAQGHWLYFLGADDRLRGLEVLERVGQFIHTHPANRLVYGDVVLASDSSRYDGEFDLQKLLHQKNICHQAIFYRRDIFEQVGNYDLRYPIWADWDLNIRCFQTDDVNPFHLDLVVADYNDLSGLSRREDDEFKKVLPVFAQQVQAKGKSPHWLPRFVGRLFGRT